MKKMSLSSKKLKKSIISKSLKSGYSVFNSEKDIKLTQNARLMAISPIDGRYRSKTEPVAKHFSEFALIRNRVFVEIKWLIRLSASDGVKCVSPFSDLVKREMEDIFNSFNSSDANEVKKFEQDTRHDVKAVEYFIRSKFAKLPNLREFEQKIHLFCTSEDITNVAYGLGIRESKIQHKDVPMVSRTHGQAASPTTAGKEFANFFHRLKHQLKILKDVEVFAKFNGAVGNFNAHHCAYPDVDWENLAKDFIENDIGLSYNAYTTQIESHDMLATLCDAIRRINVILISFCRDIWGYCSLGYFVQKVVPNEIGSSTMPHKVNPIDFENGEGNLGLANSLSDHFANKLPISRFQRDLSDSTVLRSLGTFFAHCLVAYESVLGGLARIELDRAALGREVSSSWVLMAEPIQTILSEGVVNSYEKLKELTRGKEVTKEDIMQFIETLDVTDENKERLRKLSPESYVGLAAKMAESVDSK